MVTFFSILFVLMSVNALLLVFSVNGAMDKFKKPLKKISENQVAKLIPDEYSETEYKKAV